MMQVAIGDAIAIALLEGRGFTALEFAHFHPGGKLGAMLKFVRDYMRTGAEIPVKPLGTKMSDAIMEMSAKGLGCVCIVNDANEAVGIITDGDLRRHMQKPDLLTLSVDDIMTRQPKTVPPTMLASEMIEVLNTRKITTLVVTDADKVVGIVHLHDLLRAGVA
jgi:arabinose-5-phosphate isomerase